MTFEGLQGLTKRELAELLAAGHPIDPTALDDTEYQGISLGLPGWLVSLTWLTFMKTFHRDPASGALRGWNVRLQQDGLDAPCRPQERRGAPHTFGHYTVTAAPPGTPGNDRGLLIDYACRPNATLDPIRRVRDPLVALNPGDPNLLLGWSYVDVGFTVGTPSYFGLRRRRPLSHRA
jgi:hypothetical protein